VYLEELTNRILYNRIKRNVIRILRNNIFEQNDSFTRDAINTNIRLFLNEAKQHAIQDFQYKMYNYDSKNPHLIKLDISLLFKNRIEYVLLSISEKTN